jgi:para-nitrobenzyl esterase
MRSKSVDQVYDAGGGLHSRQAGWGAIVDGKVVPDQPSKLIAAGAFHRVPILSGVDHREQGFFLQWRLLNGAAPWTSQDFAQYLKGKPHAEQLQAAYAGIAQGSPDLAWVAVESDEKTCRAVEVATAAAKYTPSSFYDFNDPNAAATIFDAAAVPRGAFHASDIPYLFQRGYPNEAKPGLPDWTPAQVQLSARLQNYFAAFLSTSSPAKAAEWPRLPAGARYLTPDGDKTVALPAFAQEHHCELFQ